MTDHNNEVLVAQSSERDAIAIVSDANSRARATGSAPNRVDQNTRRTRGEKTSVEPRQPTKTRTISERKLQANRANAKKSTGPRTDRGKRWSRRNAIKHGLLSNSVLFRPDRTASDPELQAMKEDLEQRYGADELRTDPVVEAIIVELSHQRTAAELEQRCLEEGRDDSSGPINLRTLLRYRSRSHRQLLKSLAKFHELG